MGASNKAGGRLTTDAGWQLPFASFVNPTYIGPGNRNTGVVPSTGFALGSSAGLVIQFSGTYTGITLIHEQTLDPDGATGWFPVAGQVISGAPGTPGSGLATTGSAYCFPSFGALHRIRVTAMASGTVIVFAGLIYDVYDVSTAGGGGGGGGDVNIESVGGNPVTTTIPVSGTVAVTGVSTAANQALTNTALGTPASTPWDGLSADADAIAILKAQWGLLNTPAAQLPKTPLMATSDLTYVFNSSSASTTRNLVTATASQTAKAYILIVSAAGATTLTFTDGAGGAVLFTVEFPAAGAYTFDLNSRPYFKTGTNTALDVISSAAVKTTVGLYYVKSA